MFCLPVVSSLYLVSAAAVPAFHDCRSRSGLAHAIDLSLLLLLLLCYTASEPTRYHTTTYQYDVNSHMHVFNTTAVVIQLVLNSTNRVPVFLF